MPTTPGDFLAAMAGSTAGMVAIVGGLLVSRYVGLDSEQMTARRLAKTARGRHKVAKSRLTQLEDEHEHAEAEYLLDNDQVLEAISNDKHDTREIRRISHASDAQTSDEVLSQHIGDVTRELNTAMTFILEKLEKIVEGKSSRDLGFEIDWEQFKVDHIAENRITRNYVWSWAYDRCYKYFIQVAKKREKHELGPHASLLSLGAPPVIDASQMRPPWEGHLEEQARIDRRNEIARAKQHLEDLEAEELRHTSFYYHMAKPDKILYFGLAVLLYYTIVGLVMPIYHLSKGPETFTPAIEGLFFWFTSGLASFVIYMLATAIRLARVRDIPYD